MTDKQQPTPPASVDTGGGAYIGGNVDTGGGAFAGRDQTITQVNETHGVSLAEFTALLAELRAALPAAGLDADTAEIIDADVQVVEAQAAKPQPSAAVITSKLEGVAKVLAAAGGVAVAAQKLLPMAQQALEWAKPLFG
ncbi:MAG: hypothetical protein KDI03_12280 [Anaerolineae bacterium]|nr:hypothetical protein [Anaerolineae bacterium]